MNAVVRAQLTFQTCSLKFNIYMHIMYLNTHHGTISPIVVMARIHVATLTVFGENR